MFIHLSVLVILLQVAVLSQGRSLRQRGQRFLYHPTEPNQNDYYYPQIDGQPIYLPPIGQSPEDMKELLDYYYNRNEAFVPEWTSVPPVSYNYDIQDKYYEDPSMSNGMVTDYFDKDHRGNFHVLPGTKQSILSPTVNHDKYLEYEDKFKDLDDHVPETFSKTKHNSIKPTHEQNIPYTKSMLEYTGEKDPDADEYYSPEIVSKFNRRTGSEYTNVKETKSEVGYVDKKIEDMEEYDLPEIVKKTNKKELKSTKLQKPKLKLDHSSNKEIDSQEFYAPQTLESVKIKKSKGKTNQKVKYDKEYLEDEYEEPSVHKVIKKEKLDKDNKHQKYESSTAMDHLSDDYYEQPSLIKISKEKKKNKKHNKGKRSKHQVSKRYGMDTVDALQAVTETDAEFHDLESLELEHEFFKVKDETPKLYPKSASKNEKEVNYDLKETPVHKEKMTKTEPNKDEKVKEKAVIKTKSKEKHETKIVKNEPEMFEYEEVETEQREEPVKKVVKEKTEPNMNEYEDIIEKPAKEKVVIKTEPEEKTEIVKTESELPEYEEIVSKPVKEKVVIKTKPVKEKVIKTKPLEKHEKTEIVNVKTEIPEYEMTEHKEKPVKVNENVKTKEKPEKVVIKTKQEKTEKVVIKTKPKEKPEKVKEKVVVKTKPIEKPEKVKEKVVVKTKPIEKPEKVKEKVVVKTKPKEKPEKVVIKTDSKDPDLEEYDDKKSKLNVENEISDGEEPLEWQESTDQISDFDFVEDIAESTFPDFEHSNNPNEALNVDENESDFENIGSGTVENEDPTNVQRLFPHADSLKRLSALNSNIWSLLFNPNAERNKLKKCTTRSNETGYCTYIQHCDVPNIASSLEELLINACVMDDVFIGICCPEFPVETVKVHWDQDTSNSDKKTEDEFVHTADDCGIRSNEASKVQAWPWKAPLVSMSNGKIFCGGILINEEYVLTAAHCTTKIPRNQILVRLGQYNSSTGDDFAVVEIKRHAQYNPRTMHHDIALLKLGRRVAIDDFTGVICLPEESDDEDEHEGEKALLLGWKGLFGTKSKSNEVLKVMDNEECRKKLRMNISTAVLCTEARNEDERACNADSGAPLVIEDDDKYEVIGILSWNRNDCDQRFPSTFSRVSKYVEWIRKHAV